MSDFIVKNIVSNDIEKELENIGFDTSYKFIAADKYKYKNIKVYHLNSAQANILKQTALSVGADCATHRDVITGTIEDSNVILGGSYSQIKLIAEKLKNQPFSLEEIGNSILTEIQTTARKTKLVGIVNVTPDSFSDGGKYFNPDDAIRHAIDLIKDGADIIDIGAESTRPFSNSIPAEEQMVRLVSVLDRLAEINVPVSIDTRSAKVAEYALKHGVKIINDVSGFDFDPRMADIAANSGATVILQHSKGTPENMQNNPVYKDVVEEVYINLLKKMEYAKSKGINNIILDIGIGFGKSKKDNFELLNRIEEFYSLNCPIMVGVSRKSLLGLENSNDNDLKDSLSLAISYPLIQKGVDYLRVHNVRLHKQLLNSAI